VTGAPGWLASVLWVALGSALGGVARFLASVLVAERLGDSFPWGTLLVNLTGSFLIGLLASLALPDGRPLLGPSARLLLMTGVLGGYTTFSALSLQTLQLLQAGQPARAGLYVAASVALCLLAVWAGHASSAVLGR